MPRSSNKPDTGASTAVEVAASWREDGPNPLPATLVAAKDAFHARGFHGTTIRDIAARAAVSLPTLYYHHDNKQGILVALLEESMSSVLRRVRLAIADSDDPTTQLSNAVEAIVLHMTADLELASVAREVRYLDPDNPHRRRYVEMRGEVEDILDEVLERGVADGSFHLSGDRRDVLRYLLGACQEVTTWYSPSGSRTPAEVAASYAEISLRLVGAHR